MFPRSILSSRTAAFRVSVRLPPSPSFVATRRLTTASAERLLGLSSITKYTARDLRDAYFDAAKRCHPDSSHNKDQYIGVKDPGRHFLAVTEAYEMLQGCMSVSTGTSWYETEASFVTKSEEEEFRDACKEWLGLPAETVEESKRCPVFREWLEGNTDAAMIWSNFFALNEGLAPKLRPPAALIGEGSPTGGINRRTRRSRKRPL